MDLFVFIFNTTVANYPVTQEDGPHINPIYDDDYDRRIVGKVGRNLYNDCPTYFLIKLTVYECSEIVGNKALWKGLHLQRKMMTSSDGNIFRVIGPLCGNSPVTGEFPSERPVMRSFDVSFDLCLNRRLSKQSIRRLFETPPCLLFDFLEGQYLVHISYHIWMIFQNVFYLFPVIFWMMMQVWFFVQWDYISTDGISHFKGNILFLT